MGADELIPLVRGIERTTDVAAVVWDGAPSHRDARLGRIPVPHITLPPYAPELNPAERVFEELRAEVEGVVSPTLDAKVAAMTARFARWDADPAAVRRLAGWGRLTAASDALPDPDRLPIAASSRGVGTTPGGDPVTPRTVAPSDVPVEPAGIGRDPQ